MLFLKVTNGKFQCALLVRDFASFAAVEKGIVSSFISGCLLLLVKRLSFCLKKVEMIRRRGVGCEECKCRRGFNNAWVLPFSDCDEGRVGDFVRYDLRCSIFSKRDQIFFIIFSLRVIKLCFAALL